MVEILSRFSVVEFKLSELIRFMLPNHCFSSISYLHIVITNSGYVIGLGTRDTLFCVTCTAKCIGEWQEARIMQIDFSASFDRIEHKRILYKLCSVGVRHSVLPISTQFLSNWSQHVMVNGCQSKQVNDVPGVPQCCVLCQLMFLMHPS